MENKLILKSKRLLTQTRVMTVSVAKDENPWSAPVYFVYEKSAFFFFSNPESRHIQYALDTKKMCASIFHDADNMEDIFGIQMSGCMEKICAGIQYIKIVKAYVNKFNFLSQQFGEQILKNPDFFKEKFKSDLYGFYPETIFLSDNSRSANKRISIDIKDI
ncbi:MAG: pyridoxamine 5'-phosphate oxidase family protein [Proteobacteria bacterium]|nr:pyridoxamine 5'-phosphate oxidase family protein [Pseudomonadota bacterium]MBU1386574.1 pyridoxamine 5'-phosphate oxidase family protein [Pseudomonadota bacterium]MBU1542475.1 pyridoxamine 5'-phosphate oxidase family protein [Pseudomonadota bacterium]MBU2480582.1 pyridoxamine 5'-phosphate oxidase family protein [Pseudomonadota bacterium]